MTQTHKQIVSKAVLFTSLLANTLLNDPKNLQSATAVACPTQLHTEIMNLFQDNDLVSHILDLKSDSGPTYTEVVKMVFDAVTPILQKHQEDKDVMPFLSSIGYAEIMTENCATIFTPTTILLGAENANESAEKFYTLCDRLTV